MSNNANIAAVNSQSLDVGSRSSRRSNVGDNSRYSMSSLRSSLYEITPNKKDFATLCLLVVVIIIELSRPDVFTSEVDNDLEERRSPWESAMSSLYIDFISKNIPKEKFCTAVRKFVAKKAKMHCLNYQASFKENFDDVDNDNNNNNISEASKKR